MWASDISWYGIRIGIFDLGEYTLKWWHTMNISPLLAPGVPQGVARPACSSSTVRNWYCFCAGFQRYLVVPCNGHSSMPQPSQHDHFEWETINHHVFENHVFPKVAFSYKRILMVGWLGDTLPFHSNYGLIHTGTVEPCCGHSIELPDDWGMFATSHVRQQPFQATRVWLGCGGL